MPSLLETINQNASALSAPTPESNPLLARTGLQPTGGESTEGTAQIAAVGQTGKAAGTMGGRNIRLSSLGERLASVQALNQAKEVTKEAQIQGISLDQQQSQLQQEFEQQNTQISEQQIGMREQFNTQLKGIMQNYKTQLAGLDLSRDKARMEQVGFMLRLGNQQYIDQLQLEGKKARLNSAAGFQDALQQTVFADEMDLFSNSLEFRNLMQADARNFQQELGRMDLEFALQVAKAENKAAGAQMMWSGVGTLVGAGLSYSAGQEKAVPKTGVEQTEGAPLQSAMNAPAPPVSSNLGTLSTQPGGLLEGYPQRQAPLSWSANPYISPGTR